MKMHRRFPTVLICLLADLFVWFDWYLYIAFKGYIAPHFFPLDAPATRGLQTAAIFAVGFLMRPMGALLFGKMAKNRTRTYAIFFSVGLMSLGTLLILLVPGYAAIGIMAPRMLLISRVLQGIGLGGLYGPLTSYMSEVVPDGKRGFYSGFQYTTLILGVALAIGTEIVLSGFSFPPAFMEEWGWRIPFAGGACITLILACMLFRRNDETTPYEDMEEHGFEDESSNKKWWKFRRRDPAVAEPDLKEKSILSRFLLVAGLTAGGTLAFYTYTIVMPSYLYLSGHFSVRQTSVILFVCLLVFAVMQPFFGWLSDKKGRRPLLIGFGIAGVIFTFPIYYGLRSATDPWVAGACIMASFIIVSGYTSVSAIVKAELFPTWLRALGAGFPYALAVAFFGGPAEYFALEFRGRGYEGDFFLYVTTVIFMSLMVYLFMKETKDNSQLH